MENLKCPNCSCVMTEVVEPDMKFEQCPECKGRFYDKGELNEVLTGLYGNIEMCSVSLNDTSMNEEILEKNVRNCPKCESQAMRKINLLLFDDIVYDFCPSCEGFFLDDKEADVSNRELGLFSDDGTNDEYRKDENGFLVKGAIADAVQISTGMAGMTYAQEGKIFKISVLYPEALNIGLRVSPEKWTFKLGKFLRLSKAQDIVVGDDDFDANFQVQGVAEDKVINVLSADVMTKLNSFKDSPLELFAKSNSLEVNDSGIHYTEGPFTNVKDFDFDKESLILQRKLTEIATLIYGNAKA